jgi:WXG100 family type VII secretion target
MAVVGAELTQLDQLTRTFGEQAGQVGSIRSRIDNVLSSTTWTGPAAERFRADWSQFAPTLARLSGSLTEAGSAVRRRREAIAAATA